MNLIEGMLIKIVGILHEQLVFQGMYPLKTSLTL